MGAFPCPFAAHGSMKTTSALGQGGTSGGFRSRQATHRLGMRQPYFHAAHAPTAHENTESPLGRGKRRQALGWVVFRETIPTPALRTTPPREGIIRGGKVPRNTARREQ